MDVYHDHMLELFEIHITGDKSIVDTCKDLNLKTIEVDLLYPNKSVLRREYMTSIVQKFKDYESCRFYVDSTVITLMNAGVHVVRTKIECPFYKHYVEQSLYIESHFESKNNLYPISKNAKKDSYLATDRRYNKACYSDFCNLYQNCVVELCLYDPYIEEDADWFELYR